MPHPQLTELCASVREVFDARACVCALVLDGDVELEFVAGDGDGVHLLLGDRLRFGQGIAGNVAQTGVPVEVGHVLTDQRFASHLAVTDEYVPGTLLSSPMISAGGQVFGVLNVCDPAPEVVAEAEAKFGGALTLLVSMVAEVSRLFELTDPALDERIVAREHLARLLATWGDTKSVAATG